MFSGIREETERLQNIKNLALSGYGGSYTRLRDWGQMIRELRGIKK